MTKLLFLNLREISLSYYNSFSNCIRNTIKIFYNPAYLRKYIFQLYLPYNQQSPSTTLFQTTTNNSQHLLWPRPPATRSISSTNPCSLPPPLLLLYSASVFCSLPLSPSSSRPRAWRRRQTPEEEKGREKRGKYEKWEER